jgi:hypothetical protein
MASPFSGKAGRLAAMTETAQLQGTQDKINNAIAGGKKASLGALRSGYRDAKGDYRNAIDLLNPYAETGGKAFQSYADASGVNGQEGHDRAVANFRAGPGYQWQVDQATDAVARKSSALGALGSGNTMVAIQDRANNLADQEYDDHLGRLDNIGKTGFAATSAQAGLTKSLGDLGYNFGQNKAAVHGDATRMGVSTTANTGSQIAGSMKGGMLAGQTAAANRFGAGMSLASLGASLLGGGMGGGMGSLFGGAGASRGPAAPVPQRQFEYPVSYYG